MCWVLKVNFFHLKKMVELNEEKKNDLEGTLVTTQIIFQSLPGDLGLVFWFQ